MGSNKNEKEVLSDFLVGAFHTIMKEEEYCIAKRYHNLSVKEMRVIDMVCRAEKEHTDNRVTVIANSLRVTAGTLTTAVTSLERKGYIIRERDTKDRRIVRLIATDLGKEAFEFHIYFYKELVNQVVGMLSEEEVRIFAKGLLSVTEFFQKK